VVRCDDERFCSALRTALDPPEAGTFTPCDRRHDTSWEDPLLLGDAAAAAPPPELPQAVTAASKSAAPPAIRPACRLLMVVFLRTALGLPCCGPHRHDSSPGRPSSQRQRPPRVPAAQAALSKPRAAVDVDLTWPGPD
jgi:hypothetical protein